MTPGPCRRIDIRYYGNKVEVLQPAHIVGFVRKSIPVVDDRWIYQGTDVAILLPQGEVAVVPATCIKEVIR